MLFEIDNIKIVNNNIYPPFSANSNINVEWAANVSKYHTIILYNITDKTYNFFEINIPGNLMSHGILLYDNLEMNKKGKYIIELWLQPKHIPFNISDISNTSNISLNAEKYDNFIKENMLIGPIDYIEFFIENNKL